MDAIVQVKYFTPDGNWTWWATEYDPVEKLFFGLVEGFERELGYFSLAELESGRGALGLPIERDLHWTPKPLKDLWGELAMPEPTRKTFQVAAVSLNRNSFGLRSMIVVDIDDRTIAVEHHLVF